MNSKHTAIYKKSHPLANGWLFCQVVGIRARSNLQADVQAILDAKNFLIDKNLISSKL